MSLQNRGRGAPAIMGAGMCTPLGLTAQATQVEMAAGTVRFFESSVLDRTGEPVRASMLTLLEQHLTRTQRMQQLAVTALQESLKNAVLMGIEQLPLLLALPEPGSGSSFDSKVLLDDLKSAATPVRLELSESTLFHEGRAGFFHALNEACQLLKSHRASWVLVGGVDSMCDQHSLRHHAQLGRTLGPSTRDGILPGEGAGFFLLSLGPLSARSRLPEAAWVVGSALSREPHCFLQPKANLATGLADAFRQLRHHPTAGTRRVNHVLSCQTGESFWAQEFNYAYLRNSSLMPEPLTTSLVAENLGDVGAAAGAIQFGRALHHLRKLRTGQAEAPRVLIYGCGDAGQIGSCIIEGAS